ncbi:MAG: hypothetical protein D6E12_05295 [Desulfovibrio sp.]|nr:MAG: hypothetical protein D6E12_05295 [Desulfovibrio sp.]
MTMIVQGYIGQGLSPFVSRSGTFGSGPGFSLSSQTLQATSQAFAQDIVRRSAPAPQEEPQLPGGAQPAPTVSKEGDGLSSGGSELESSLAGAVDYIRGQFGDKAATAFMGLVYQGIGNSEVTEENLGRGLLQGVRFLDRNFGFAAGDKALNFFNGDLNQAMNDHFQNGLNEQFYASTWQGADIVSLSLSAAEGALDSQDAETPSLLESLQATLEELTDATTSDPASLEQGLETVASVLAERGLIPAETDPARLLAASTDLVPTSLPIKGATLNITA